MRTRKSRTDLSLPKVRWAILWLGVWLVSLQDATAQTAPQIEWAQYLPDSRSTSITSDALGNVYISGNNLLPGAFLAKLDPTGNLLWQHQWGEGGLNPLSMAMDGVGNIFFTGQYVPPSRSRSYAMFAKFDEDGNVIWNHQIDFGETTTGLDVTADVVGNIYICGHFGTKTSVNPVQIDSNGFVAQFSTDGNQQWLRTFGTDKSEEINGVTTDLQGNVYFTGTTKGNLFGTNAGGWDLVDGKLDSGGALIWAQQLGTEKNDTGRAISFSPEGTLYTLGNTDGDLAGDVTPYQGDPFVRKLDLSGNELWTRQLGLERSLGADLTTDGVGGVFLGGMKWPSSGVTDGWAAKYDSVGNLKWTTEFGTDNLFDDAWSISALSPFGIYIGGLTSTTYSPPDGSAFVVKLVEMPEPSSGVMVLVAAMAFGGVCRLRQRSVA